jgi:hypothetical protein
VCSSDLSINQWIKQFNDKLYHISIGFMGNYAPDFQKIHHPYITIQKGDHHVAYFSFNITNLIEGAIYFAVRLCIQSSWLNDRDQFRFPNNKWKNDIEFHNNCLAFTLFHSQNRITVKDGVNHWIPFTEAELAAKHKFESHFMSSFLSGKIKQNGYANLFEQGEGEFLSKREFSKEATNLFDAGLQLWRYYHTQPNINVNASLYDIREYFQGINPKGKMNSKSADQTYNKLIAALRAALKTLTFKIEPKVYEYGFLKT